MKTVLKAQPKSSSDGVGSFVITSWDGLQICSTWEADGDASGMQFFPDHHRPGDDSLVHSALEFNPTDETLSPLSQYPLNFDEVVEYDDDESNESSSTISILSENTRNEDFQHEDEIDDSYSSFEDYASNLSDSCGTSTSNGVRPPKKMQVASRKHRKWLFQLAAETKIRKENELASKRAEIKKARRMKEILAQKARARRNMSYKSKTVIAEVNEVNRTKKEPIITAEEREINEKAKIERISKIRINAKKKYREFLDAVQEKRKLQADAKKTEQKNVQERRRKIKAKALTNLRNQRKRLQNQQDERQM
uniref:Uncharacterized protein n=1 Tax=Leptocylindrus danicus TaxID=163516 RepID=A0A6U2RZ10_9STRA|mmetsp:Transcript_5626/g.8259  ORF Transcript_5626/g.8259 Transcript_5626/m.8259 type:complete len:308 (+) Transcript_5626:355-1278(+)